MDEGGSLRIRLCGAFGIEASGIDLPAAVLPGRQGRLVFAYLVCARPRAVPRDELADLLWPQRLPESWAASLSAVISKLRRLLATAGLDAGTVLVTSGAGVELHLPDGVWVDWEAAQQAVESAETAVRAGDHRGAVAAASDALAIAGDGFRADACEWVDAQRAAAQELCVRAAVAAGEAHLLAGAATRAVECARDAVRRAPGRETGHRLLMRALAASGERAEALRAWERCRAEVVEELGVEPSAQTEAVYLEILGAQQAPAAATAAGATPLPSGVVTFLLTDIVESSAMWERDSAAMDAALARHDALIADVVAGHGGTLLKSKLEGDATVSVFPRATAGALAALAIRDALGSEAWSDAATPVVRIALHTGEAFERGGDYYGPSLNRAARLRALASRGQVLVSQATAELVVDHLPADVRLVDRGHRDLRGLSRGENVFELAPVGDTVPAAEPNAVLARRPPLPPTLVADAPFVGREEELGRLAAVFDRALAEAPRSVLVAGEPGVGKSRLVAEAAAAAHGRGAVVLAGRCDEELGAPLQPFVECLRQLLPRLDPDRVAALHGVEDLARLVPDLVDVAATAVPRADPDSERYVLFDAVARLLAIVATQAPVVLVLDDLHWAGKTTLLLLRHLLRHSGTARLLVLGTYRDTELGRTHPLGATLADLRRDGTAERMNLGGLAPEDVDAYLHLVGRVDRALSTELSRVTAGNPFFLIETLRHVEESGGQWDPDDLPEGVRDATGRRLSRLSGEANNMLHVAAVAGPAFSLEVVEQLAGRELVDEITEACTAALVVEDDGTTGRFRFAHALVRQVLLDELVTVRRVRLHRAIAELLEARPGTDADTRLTELARHWFECAAAGDAARAVAACRRAADRATERLAFTEAAELYGMAAEAAGHERGAGAPGDVERAELLVARCEALLAAGDAAPARAALAELESSARGSARLNAWHAVLAAELAVVAEPDRLGATVPTLREAATVLHDQGDLGGEARAHYVHALALERLGRIGAAEQMLDRALAAARACGDRRLIDAVLASAPEAALWGPSPVTRASGRCLDVVRVLRITGGAPAVEAVALRCQAMLEALRGRLDAARGMVASARRTFEELGLAPRLLETDVTAALIELTYAHAAEAEQRLRPALDALRERGLDAETARAAAMLGRALLAQGKAEEAETVGEEAARLAGADLRAGVAWRAVLALAAAARGDGDRALALGREAVDLAAATDALLLEVDARMALAEVLRQLGDAEAAEKETYRAAKLCERKGATTLLAHAAARAAPASRETSADAGARRIHENRATETGRHLAALVNAGDVDGWRARLRGCVFYRHDVGELTHEEGMRYLSHGDPVPLTGTVTPLAALGRRIALQYGAWDMSPGENARWGDATLEMLSVVEVDDGGRVLRTSMFPPTHLGPAVVLLFERYAETEADDAERARALAAARAVAEWRDAHEDLVLDDVLECDLDHAVLTVRAEHDPEAVEIRFAPAPRPGWERFERTAPINDLDATFNARDVDAFRSIMRPDVEVHDRRAGRHTVSGLDEQLAQLRDTFAASSLHASSRLLATRGRRVSLAEHWYRGAWGSSGPIEVGLLAVTDCDEDRRVARTALFDVGDLDAAFATLDEWYADQRDPTWKQFRLGHLYSAGDLNAMADFVAPDVLYEDHRALGHGVVQGRAAWLDVVRPMREPLVDVTFRELHVLESERATFGVTSMSGSVVTVGVSEPMPFENRYISVGQHADDGRMVHWHVYDEDHLNDALDCYDSLAADEDAPRHASAWERVVHPNFLSDEAFNTRDADAFLAMLHPDLRVLDLRTGHPREYGRDELLAMLQFSFSDTSLVCSGVLVASRGHRMAMVRRTFRGSWGASGAVELAMLSVGEVDADGRAIRSAMLDTDDLDAAYRIMDEWYLEGRDPGWPPSHDVSTRLYVEADWDAFAALFAPDFVVEDHRLAGHETRRGRDESLALVRPMRAQLIDVDIRTHHLLECAGGQIIVGDHAGAVDVDASGQLAPFQTRLVVVAEWGTDGLVRRWDIYEDAQLEEAFARYESIVARSSDPFRNRVDEVMDRFARAVRANDRAAAEHILAEPFAWSDRRRLAPHGTGDVGSALASLFDLAATAEWHFERLATRGQRLALYRHSSSFSALVEIDADDGVCTTIVFDDDAIDAAFDELDERFARGEGAPHAETWARALEGLRRLNEGDVYNAFATDDWEVHDHRPTMFGHLDGDSWTAAMQTIDDLAPRHRLRVDHVLGLGARGQFLVVSRTGVDRGGGEFEMAVLVVGETDGAGRARRTDLYALDQLDEASGRYQAIGALPERDTPPEWERFEDLARLAAAVDDAFNRRDLAAYRALVSPDVRVYDFRPGHPAEYGLDEQLALLAFNFEEASLRATSRLVATRGERLGMFDHHYSGVWQTSAEVELGLLSVLESDASGRGVRTALFESDQIDAAYATLDDWYYEIRDHSWPYAAVYNRYASYLSGDADEMAEVFAADLVFEDHRLTGRGVVRSRDAVLEMVRSMRETLRDAEVRPLHFRECPGGSIGVGRMTGTMTVAAAGTAVPFENLIVAVSDRGEDGLIHRWDVYDADQLPDAWARYDALA